MESNIVYVRTSAGSLYALNAITGQTIWEFATRSVYSTPAVANSTVFFGSFDQNVYAVDAKTGQLKWKRENNDSFTTGSEDGHLYCLDAVTGEQKWEFNTGDYVWGSPCEVASDGVVRRGLGDLLMLLIH